MKPDEELINMVQKRTPAPLFGVESGSIAELAIISAALVTTVRWLAVTVPLIVRLALEPGATEPTVQTPVDALKLPLPVAVEKLKFAGRISRTVTPFATVPEDALFVTVSV